MLATRGRSVCLVVHQDDPGVERLLPQLPGEIKVVDLSGLPRVETCSGDLSPYIPAYRDAVRWLVSRTHRPVVVVPTLLGDSFGIAAALSVADPELIRVIGWQHSPIAYDATVLSRYEPLIAAFVGVSDEICASQRAAHPGREGDIRTVIHGVRTPQRCPARPPLEGRPLTLIYAGRMENNLKRAVSLVAISDRLSKEGIDHRMTLLGDGPATEEIDSLIAKEGRATRMRRLRPMSPEGVERLFSEHDAFILPSRIEGLSMSVMEAMAQGCVPVISRTTSGAGTLVDHERTGMLVDVEFDADEGTIAERFCAAVRRAKGIGIGEMSAAAHARAAERFSLEAYGDACERVIEAAGASAPRRWPTDRACAFTASTAAAGSGAVPQDGATRLRELLSKLKGRAIVVHGTGRHTIELGAVFAASEARIAAFTDDDPKRQGEMLWNWPIVAPASAGRTGATDVVISSWMNQDAVWERRGVYEKQGMGVWRVYG